MNDQRLSDSYQAAPASRFPWAIVLLLALSAFVFWRWLNIRKPVNQTLLAQTTNPEVAPRIVTPRADLTIGEQSTIRLFRKCSGSVVFVKASAVGRTPFSVNPLEIPKGTGSGFVWDKEGHIVTNFHVLHRANRARVILPDQSSWDATLVGIAPHKDLAVMKIDAPSELLEAIPVGTSRDLQVGQSVLAIGSPFGLDQTLTTGVVSGVDREIKALTGRRIGGVIQTDAAINPGNSGGPLLDSSGRLVGVNTAIVSPSGAYAGIGFAIPVDTVNRIVPQLIQNGRVTRPWLGIELASPEVLRQSNVAGVLVLHVKPGSSAEAAGIRPTIIDDEVQLGDIIVQIDETRIETSDDVFDFLERHQVGHKSRIVVLRSQPDRSVKRVELTATLQAELEEQ